MNDLDARIREALSQDDNVLQEATRTEAGVWELFFSTMRGRNRFFGIMVNIWIFVFSILTVYTVYRFFHTPDIREAITWVAAAFVCVIFVSFLKLWVWMEMNKNAVLREVKRVELQVALILAEREKS